MKQIDIRAFNISNFNRSLKRKVSSFKKTAFYFISSTLLLSLGNQAFADVTLTTSAVAAANINQGTNTNIVYAVKMDVATTAVTVNNLQFTLTGTLDANDLVIASIYFNPTTPDLSGATLLNNVSAAFASGHLYNVPFTKAMAVGSSGYYIITVNVDAAGTDNHTLKVNGAANPVVFGFTTGPTIVNNQSDIAGAQTIQAADVTETSSTIAAADINQGTNTNIVYAVKMDVATTAVTVNNLQFTLTGTLDANDLVIASVYFNAATPDLSGATLLNNVSAAFASGHVYNVPFTKPMALGSSGYYIITVNADPAGTDNHTLKVNGAANPVVFGFTTSPNIVNNQSDIAALQTIQAADVTETSSTIAAANINQGTNTNIVYAVKMDVATTAVTVNNLQFTLTGTLDANDLVIASIYFNPTTPDLSGATLLNNVSAAFASGHLYNVPFTKAMALGSSGYYIITVNVDAAGTDNHTLKVNGAANPVVFAFTTSPNIVNNQSDIAGLQTIQAADVTETSSTIAAADINQGTNTNIVYAVKMDVTTTAVTVNNLQFNLTGTLDANDLVIASIYFNPTTPDLSGATLLNNVSAAFASGHVYNVPFTKQMALGSSGYYIITVNADPAGTDNHTLKVNGAANPVVFGFTTSPNIINNQSDIAGIQTIQAADITLATSTVATNIFGLGSNSDIVYVSQMQVATEPVTVNNLQFTLTGTHIANDLTIASVYFNASMPNLSGATLLNNVSAAFASGHSYSVPLTKPMAIGSSGYYIITVNVSPTATIGNTVIIDGAVNPVIFGFTTGPNITNNQSNIGGVHTLPVHFVSIEAAQKDKSIEIKWNVDNEMNIEKYMLERSDNGSDFIIIGQTAANGNNTNMMAYHSLDDAPLPGNNFYRVYAVNLDGTKEYSSVVKINMDKNFKGISIYPNPVIKKGLVTMAFQNMDKNKYSVKLYSQQGQCIMARSIEHNGGNSTQTISLPKIAAGNYILVVSTTNMNFEKQILVE